MYTTNSPEACHYVLENASCQIVVVENDAQLQKILQVRDRLPELRSIIQYKGEPPEDCLNVLSVSFCRASYVSTVLAVIVYLSVTSRSCTKVAKPRITLTTVSYTHLTLPTILRV